MNPAPWFHLLTDFFMRASGATCDGRCDTWLKTWLSGWGAGHHAHLRAYFEHVLSGWWCWSGCLIVTELIQLHLVLRIFCQKSEEWVWTLSAAGLGCDVSAVNTSYYFLILADIYFQSMKIIIVWLQSCPSSNTFGPGQSRQLWRCCSLFFFFFNNQTNIKKNQCIIEFRITANSLTVNTSYMCFLISWRLPRKQTHCHAQTRQARLRS